MMTLLFNHQIAHFLCHSIEKKFGAGKESQGLHVEAGLFEVQPHPGIALTVCSTLRMTLASACFAVYVPPSHLSDTTALVGLRCAQWICGGAVDWFSVLVRSGYNIATMFLFFPFASFDYIYIYLIYHIYQIYQISSYPNHIPAFPKKIFPLDIIRIFPWDITGWGPQDSEIEIWLWLH